jgi:flagellar assembly protein FliH
MSAKLFRGVQVAVEDFPWETFPVPDVKQPASPPTGEAGTAAPHSDEVQAPSAAELQLDAMRREMEMLRQDFQARLEAARRQALEEGKNAAREEARAEREAMQKQLARSLEESVRARQVLLERTDEDLVRLAVAIAEKVLNREMHTDPDALRGIARAALDRIAGKEVQVVRMHSDDQHAVEKELGTAERQAIRLIADPSLQRGALLFETGFGILDCSIATQLEEIERGLTDRVRRSSH